MKGARMHKVIEHSWEETSIVGRSGKTLCRFSIHDLGRVTENNQGNLESVQQERVSMVLNAINSHTALVEALGSTTVSLIAAIDLLKGGGKKIAPSNKMFAQMLRDYEKSVNVGKEALAQAKGGA
jgi:hypothetical protein